jgi:hypothetical protein
MSWQTPFLIYAAVVGLITYIAARYNAPKWLAVGVPNASIGILLAYTVIGDKWAAGEGGALPWWFLLGPLFGSGLVASLIVVFWFQRSMANHPLNPTASFPGNNNRRCHGPTFGYRRLFSKSPKSAVSWLISKSC